MTKAVVCLSPQMDVLEAMQLFVENRISGAPVMNDRGDLVGVLTERDCLRTLIVAGYHGESGGGSVAQYMSQDVATVDVDTSLFKVAQLFVNSKYRRYPVMAENRLVGIVSRRDVISVVLKLA